MDHCTSSSCGKFAVKGGEHCREHLTLFEWIPVLSRWRWFLALAGAVASGILLASLCGPVS